jgi:ADP-ribosylglycohydrolase
MNASRVMTTRDRVVGMLLGVGVGDGLGRVVEGWPLEEVRSTFGRIENYIVPDGWPADKKAGTTTDDSLLSLSVAEGLLMSGGKPDINAQVEAHVKAFHESTQGWGPTTYGAVKKLTQGVPWRLAGARGGRITGLGNGCPMRISPAALLLVQGIPEATEFIGSLCSLTHQTSVAVSAGLAHASGLAYCLKSDPATFSPGEFVKVMIDASRLGRDYFPDTLTRDDITERLALCGNFAEWPPERCVAEMEGGRSYVHCSLPFTYMFFLRNPTSVESLYDVASQGQDADTNGSMLASMLGALNGTAVFPAHLVDELEDADRLVTTAHQLCDLFAIR